MAMGRSCEVTRLCVTRFSGQRCCFPTCSRWPTREQAERATENGAWDSERGLDGESKAYPSWSPSVYANEERVERLCARTPERGFYEMGKSKKTTEALRIWYQIEKQNRLPFKLANEVVIPWISAGPELGLNPSFPGKWRFAGAAAPAQTQLRPWPRFPATWAVLTKAWHACIFSRELFHSFLRNFPYLFLANKNQEHLHDTPVTELWCRV